MILIPTVQHTGTHFVVGLFGVDVRKANKPGMQNGDPYQVIFEHIPNQLSLLLHLAAAHPTVIPLRHPRVTAISWKARNKSEERMCDDFRVMVEKFDPLHPYYIPVDSEKRQECLDKINSDLDLNIQTDWTPMGVKKNNSHLSYQDVESSEVVNQLCEDIKPFLDRFYDT